MTRKKEKTIKDVMCAIAGGQILKNGFAMLLMIGEPGPVSGYFVLCGGICMASWTFILIVQGTNIADEEPEK